MFAAYEAAVHRGDTAAIEALVAPDATRPPMAMCPPQLTDRQCLVHVVTRNTRLTTLDRKIDGDVITARLEVRNDLTRAAGIERLAGTDRIRVKDGKIVDFAFLRDEQDPQTAPFFDHMRRTMGPRPGAGASAPAR